MIGLYGINVIITHQHQFTHLFNLTLSQETAVCHPRFQPTFPIVADACPLHVEAAEHHYPTPITCAIRASLSVCLSVHAHSQSGVYILGDVTINKPDMT